MENRFSTENLKVGDKVKVFHSSGLNGSSYYVGVIIKKTPTGLVDVSYGGNLTERFRPTGASYVRSNGYSRSYTCIDFLTPEDEVAITEQNESRAMVNWLSKFGWDKLDHSELKKVVATVQELKNS